MTNELHWPYNLCLGTMAEVNNNKNYNSINPINPSVCIAHTHINTAKAKEDETQVMSHIWAATETWNPLNSDMTKFVWYETTYLLSVSPWLFFLSLTQLNEVVAENLFTVTHLLDTPESFIFAMLCCEVVEWRPGKRQLMRKWHGNNETFFNCTACSGALLFSSRVLCPSLIKLSSRSGRCAVSWTVLSYLWHPPFCTSSIASSAPQNWTTSATKDGCHWQAGGENCRTGQLVNPESDILNPLLPQRT